MEISSVGCTSCGPSSDYEVMKLQAKIDDWKCCPTTDPKTKQEKVDALEIKMSAAKAAIESKQKQQDQLKIDSETAKAMQSYQTGTGRIVDVSR